MIGPDKFLIVQHWCNICKVLSVKFTYPAYPFGRNKNNARDKHNVSNNLLITATHSKGFHAHTVVAVTSNPAVTDTEHLALIFTAPCVAVHNAWCSF